MKKRPGMSHFAKHCIQWTSTQYWNLVKRHLARNLSFPRISLGRFSKTFENVFRAPVLFINGHSRHLYLHFSLFTTVNNVPNKKSKLLELNSGSVLLETTALPTVLLPLYYIWTSSNLFIVFSIQLTLRKNVDDWKRTADPCSSEATTLDQLCHNHLDKSSINLFTFIFSNKMVWATTTTTNCFKMSEDFLWFFTTSSPFCKWNLLNGVRLTMLLWPFYARFNLSFDWFF